MLLKILRIGSHVAIRPLSCERFAACCTMCNQTAVLLLIVRWLKELRISWVTLRFLPLVHSDLGFTVILLKLVLIMNVRWRLHIDAIGWLALSKFQEGMLSLLRSMTAC